jgi:hypothetical protein
MATVRTMTKYLVPGDILKGSGERVVSVSEGVSTPKGKMDVTLDSPRTNERRVAQWGRNTTINVERN